MFPAGWLRVLDLRSHDLLARRDLWSGGLEGPGMRSFFLSANQEKLEKKSGKLVKVMEGTVSMQCVDLDGG